MSYPFRKRSYYVQVWRPPIGTPVFNITTNEHMETTEIRPFAVRGVLGEEWVASTDELLMDYSTTEDVLSRVGPNQTLLWSRVGDKVFWADLAPVVNGEVIFISQGKTYVLNSPLFPEHLFGDYIVHAASNPDERFAVNGKVFALTYVLAEDLI